MLLPSSATNNLVLNLLLETAEKYLIMMSHAFSVIQFPLFKYEWKLFTTNSCNILSFVYTSLLLFLRIIKEQREETEASTQSSPIDRERHFFMATQTFSVSFKRSY